MADYSRDSEERDAITGARRQYNKALKKIGAFLTNRDWVATDRKITIIDESGATMNLNETYGELDFERLSNGNLMGESRNQTCTRRLSDLILLYSSARSKQKNVYSDPRRHNGADCIRIHQPAP